jgi:uncharacterized cupredoxin-like copper-binding protein
MRSPALLVPTLAAVLAASGCASARQEEPDVRVTLRDFAIGLSTTAVPGGELRLAVANEGPTIHELEMFTLPEGVDAAALPVDGGVADTAGPGLTLVDEVEDVAPSTSATLKLTLQPGRYALICNLPAHYQQGMHATLVVD